jgi:hypothetical protein
VDSGSFEISDFDSLEDGGTYKLGPPVIQQQHQHGKKKARICFSFDDSLPKPYDVIPPKSTKPEFVAPDGWLEEIELEIVAQMVRSDDLVRSNTEDYFVYDDILHTKFQCSKKRNPDGKWYAIPKETTTDQPLVVVVPNDFPYYLEDDIQHWVLWKLGGTCTPDDIAEGQRQIQTAIQATEFLHWINPPHLKSLPDIDHVHYNCKT